ncbi:F-box/kelch-repeat protein [Rosa sericea]
MLMDLPSDILVKILSRLPSESICCIRCVSKALLNMVDDPSFVKLHMGYTDEVPLLMSFAEDYASETNAVIASLQSVTYDGSGSALTARGQYAFQVSTTYQRDLPPYSVDFVFRNLFCFRNNCDSGVCFLINPLRGQVLRLPRNDISKIAVSQVFYDWYGMGFDSITNTLKILAVAEFGQFGKPICRAAQVLVLGTGSWRDVTPPPCRLSGNSSKSASANGDMHWLIYGNFSEKEIYGSCHIISFDFKKEKFYWTPHPAAQSSNNFWHLYLLTFRGSLAIVDTSSSQGMITKIDIWVLKDYDKKEWARDYSIDIKNFDLVRQFGLLIKVTCGQWEHGIYFKNFDKIPTFFLDLRCYSMNTITCGSGDHTKILSYTGSLISLKDYENSVGAENSTESLKSYGNLIEEEAQGFSLFKRHVLRGVSVV